MEGYTLLQLAKLIQVPPKRILAWEEAGYLEPLMKKKGSRLVRWYTPALAESLCKVKALLDQGYQLRAAFAAVRAQASEAMRPDHYEVAGGDVQPSP
jgi:DNA-binding transcriptional MerR regulator